MKCVVKNCPNERNNKELKKSFFTFPQENELLEKWLLFCKQTKPFNPKTWRICMDHFDENDICGGLQIEMGLAVKRTLRPRAVPCIHSKSGNQEQVKQLQRTENKKVVEALLSQETAQVQDVCSPIIKIEPQHNRLEELVAAENISENLEYVELLDIGKVELDDMNAHVKSLERQLNILRKKYINLKDEFWKLKRRKNYEIYKWKRKVWKPEIPRDVSKIQHFMLTVNEIKNEV